MPKYLTVAAVAKLKQCSSRNIRYHIEQGNLKATKQGRDYLILETDATAFTPRPAGKPKKT